MCSTKVRCITCGSENVKRIGASIHKVPRYQCGNDECEINTFMLEYRYKAYEPGIKEKVVEMAINGSGIRDTSRVLGINKTTVISTLKKKESGLVQVNPNIHKIGISSDSNIHICLVCQAAEIGELTIVTLMKKSMKLEKETLKR